MVNHLRETHKTGIKGAFTKYIRKKIFCSTGFVISVGSSIIVFLFLVFYSNSDYYVLLTKLIDSNMNIFPSLLGFCIGGYALIIGFGHKEMLERMSDPLKNKSNMSYFQITSSIFAVSTVIMLFTFLTSYILFQITNVGIYSSNLILCRIINISVISLLVFLTVYSISLLYYIISNIFTFGQMMHFCIRLDKLERLKNKNYENDDI